MSSDPSFLSRRASFLLAMLLSVAACLSAGQVAAQATFNFVPPGAGNSFETSTNWNPIGPPGAGDVAHFNFDATYTVLFTTSPTNAVMQILDGNVLFQPILFTVGTQTYRVTDSSRIDGDSQTHLTLSGNSSRRMELDVEGPVEVGAFFHGDLTVLSGASFSSESGKIAAFGNLALPPPTGNATIQGASAEWSITGPMVVGDAGNGTLTIEDSGRLTNTSGAIAGSDNSTSEAIVSGNGSTWTNSGELTVGFQGDASLLIERRGAVSNTVGRIAQNSDSMSEVIVRGDGSTWTNSSDLIVGQSGDGTLTIEAGGSVSNAAGFISRFSAGNGAVIVRGSGSTWTNSQDLTIGGLNDATLTIESGGSVSNFSSTIAQAAGTTSEVVVRGVGSTWTNTGQRLRVGDAGDGTLTIEGGGSVMSRLGVLAEDAGSSGTVTVRGSGSTWTNSNNLIVGELGDATLIIEDGGQVSNLVGVVSASNGVIGEAIVRGAGSTWTSTGLNGLRIGEFGNGTLTIEDGGSVSSTLGNIAVNVAGTGAVTVRGAGSTWTTSSNFVVGENGSLTIDDSGGVANTSAFVGFGTGTPAAVATVRGAGSTWDTGAGLFVGDGSVASGTVMIEQGAHVSSSTGRIAGFQTGTGDVTVRGAGSRWAITNGLEVGSRGDGTLVLANGGLVSVGGNALLANDNSFSIPAATLIFGIGDDGTGAIASGRINVTGEFFSGVAIGDVTFDLLVDQGVALSVGDTFTLVDYGSLSAGFAFDNLANGDVFTTGSHQFRVDFDTDLTGSGDLGITATLVAVPEPASFSLLLPFIIALRARNVQTTRRSAP